MYVCRPSESVVPIKSIAILSSKHTDFAPQAVGTGIVSVRYFPSVCMLVCLPIFCFKSPKVFFSCFNRNPPVCLSICLSACACACVLVFIDFQYVLEPPLILTINFLSLFFFFFLFSFSFLLSPRSHSEPFFLPFFF